MTPPYYEQYSTALTRAIATLEVTSGDGSAMPASEGLEKLSELSRNVHRESHKQFIIGNGASAAFADHMALDWTKNGKVPTLAFTGPAGLTAVANDLGYDQVYASPLQWHAAAGDLLVTISSSGNSPNIVQAIDTAKAIGMQIVTLSGLKPDNKSRQMGELNFYVPAKTYGIVECAHQVLLHMWLDRFMDVREWHLTNEQDMRVTS